MVRWPLFPSRLNIHLHRVGMGKEWRSNQNMVNSPPTVRFQGSWSPIVPKRKLLATRKMMSKHIHESPGHRLLISPTHVFMETHMLEMFFGAMHVNRLRGDIHITTPNHRLAW